MNWNIFWDVSFIVFAIGIIFAAGILYSQFLTLKKVCEACGIGAVAAFQSAARATLDSIDLRLRHIESEQTVFWNVVAGASANRLRQHEQPRRDLLVDKLVKGNCDIPELEELSTLLKNVIVEDRDRDRGMEAVLLRALAETRLHRAQNAKCVPPIVGLAE